MSTGQKKLSCSHRSYTTISLISIERERGTSEVFPFSLSTISVSNKIIIVTRAKEALRMLIFNTFF